MVFHGPVNSHQSCYLDSVLVALFLPGYNGYFDDTLLTPQPVGEITAWERAARVDGAWRGATRQALVDEVTKIRNPTHEPGWQVSKFRSALVECPYSNGGEARINFGGRKQQSVVDFMRYLFHVLGPRDGICKYQTSTTTIMKCPGVEDCDVDDLIELWRSREGSAVGYTRETAHLLADPDDARMLADSPEGTHMAVNSHGDTRLITARQESSIFLCQITPQDEYVDITRPFDIVHEYTPEDYTGPTYSSMVATRFLEAPVVCIEVSRHAGDRKLECPVWFGSFDRGEWWVDIGDTEYVLTSVICHVGTHNTGHYVTFVRVVGVGGVPQWCFYDDMLGEGVCEEVDASRMTSHECSPVVNGEVFIYCLATGSC